MNSIQLGKLVVKGLLDKILVSRDTYQKKKLKKLLKNAKENSNFYRELYKDIDVNNITPYNIAELPPVTKTQILENYNDCVCDKNIDMNDVIDFASDLNNLHKLYLDRYVIDSTSGTTGQKLKVINDKKEFEYMLAMGAVYTWPKKKYALDILNSNRPLVYIAPTDGFYASLAISKAYLGLSKSNKSEIIDFRVPINELVYRLNSINPIMIGGYVSTFLSLADEANAGRLNIDVKYMIAIGTIYSKKDRETVKKAFNCITFTSYSCTEAGEVGCECDQEHYHLSMDVIVEAADDLMNPVPDGTESNCILITNLWNTTMPMIRYRINDKCIVHSERCACGRKTKWIEVLGREAIRIPFTTKDNKLIYFTDMMFELILNDECSGYADHQLIIKDNTVEARFNISNDIMKYNQFNAIKKRIKELADKNNVELCIIMSKELPIIEDSGKIKKIISYN